MREAAEAASHIIWDPGGSKMDSTRAIDLDLPCEHTITPTPAVSLKYTGVKSPYEETLLRVLHELLPRSKSKNVVVRQGVVKVGDVAYLMNKMTYDTGASNGNYIGRLALHNFLDLVILPCMHRARLGDGSSILTITEKCIMSVCPVNDYGEELAPITTEFFIVEDLGDEAIIGLQDILGNYYDFFSELLAMAANKRRSSAVVSVGQSIIADLDDICSKFEDELYKSQPAPKKLNALVKKARLKLMNYSAIKSKIQADPNVRDVTVNSTDTGSSTNVLISKVHGWAYQDDRVEEICAAIELCLDVNTPPLLKPGDITNVG